MRLGVFIDGRNPEPWRRPWGDHYAQILDRVVEVERLGAGSVWLTEHHQFEDGYLPQPLTLAAAIAARTSRVRIGTAVVVAPFRHPRHIAEEAAIVDILSRGRLELGLAGGWSAGEFEAFGADFGRRFKDTDEIAKEVRRLLDEDGITPPPIQRPFPLWLGYFGVRGARRAGRFGMGLLAINREVHAAYVEGLQEGGHDLSTARLASVVDILVADDPEAAWARILPHFTHMRNTYRSRRHATAGRPVPPDLTPEEVDAKGRMQVLTPDAAVDTIRSLTDGLPVEHLFLWLTIAGMPDDLVDRHLELTFTKVQAGLLQR
jgi:alkanesulfonate monooxygenase SsuD/methylene tetrahydromethanopterin reductase-like flavin-dependent oxidoreductase (luciferase family)